MPYNSIPYKSLSRPTQIQGSLWTSQFATDQRSVLWKQLPSSAASGDAAALHRISPCRHEAWC